MGAVDTEEASVQTDRLNAMDPAKAGDSLRAFESSGQRRRHHIKNPLEARKQPKDRDAARYFLQRVDQTDNITPRQTRMDILASRLG